MGLVPVIALIKSKKVMFPTYMHIVPNLLCYYGFVTLIIACLFGPFDCSSYCKQLVRFVEFLILTLVLEECNGKTSWLQSSGGR